MTLTRAALQTKFRVTERATSPCRTVTLYYGLLPHAGHLGPALSADRRNPESEQEARHQGNTPGAACQAGASGRARALWYGREAAAPLADNNACVRYVWW